MTKSEFLAALERKLAHNPTLISQSERNSALMWFAEQIDDRMEEGMSEAEATASLGAPETLAEQLCAESGGEAVPEPGTRRSGTQEYVAAGELPARLVLGERNTAVELKPSSDGRFRILYEEDRYNPVEITRFGDELRFTRREIFHIFHWDVRRRTTQVLIPAGSAIALELVTSNASLSAERVAALLFSLRTSNGSLHLDGLNTEGELTAVTSNGRIVAAALSAERLKLNTSNASLKLENSSAQREIEATTSNGSITASYVQAPALSLISSNGSVMLAHTGAEKINCKTSNAKIAAEGLDAVRELTLHTSNGAISARLPGSIADYRITSAGGLKSTIPSHKAKGERSLTAITSNGKLDILFEEDE